MSITLPNGTASDETVVARFLNSEVHWQVVTDGPDATCLACGYPERHRIYDVHVDDATLIADGCPSCDTPRDASVGPDCRDGKHDACDGRALDDHTDEVVDCTCHHHRDTPS